MPNQLTLEVRDVNGCAKEREVKKAAPGCNREHLGKRGTHHRNSAMVSHKSRVAF